MIPKRKERELEAARNRKVFELYHAEAEGRFCLCGHSPAFHWDDGQGRCVDADCGCKAYDENVFAGLDTRHKKRSAADDEDGLARAMGQAERATVDDEVSWDHAVHRANNPRLARKRDRQSADNDPAVLDALEALGGDPEDL